jgi:hypothetical protein
MLPYLQAIRHAAVTMPIKIRARWNNATTAKITQPLKKSEAVILNGACADHPLD